MNRQTSFAAALVTAALVAGGAAHAQDAVFSGPQPGEKLPSFRGLAVGGTDAGKEVDPVARLSGRAGMIVFVHAVERSTAPLMTVLDQYAAECKEKLGASYVFLGADRLMLEQRVPLISRSLQIRSGLFISLDGAEGPGQYGLNSKCMLTILLARDGKVVSNFALTQPGIADAPRVLQAMATLVGDPKPPTAEELRARRMAGTGRDAPARPAATFDLQTEEGLRAAVRSLLDEVKTLREEIARLKGQPTPAAPPARPGNLPGAAPTDPQLLSLLRAFIQQSNDNATVDRILKEVDEYVKGKADLTKQAYDGWIRVLALKYGTEYAQKTGTTFVERWKR